MLHVLVVDTSRVLRKVVPAMLDRHPFSIAEADDDTLAVPCAVWSRCSAV